MANEAGEGVPESVQQEIQSANDHQLRAIIRYAQDVLRDRDGPTPQIEPRHEGEEIVSVDDRGDHIFVVVAEEGLPKKEVYHVSFVPGIEDEDGEYYWRYIGPLAE